MYIRKKHLKISFGPAATQGPYVLALWENINKQQKQPQEQDISMPSTSKTSTTLR